MKKKNLLFSGIAASLFLVACQSAPKEASDDKKMTDDNMDEVKTQVCYYKGDNEKTTVKWTAFKTSDKIAVGGQFDEVDVVVLESMSIEEALMNTSFTIPVASTNTNNPARDTKIKESFFGALSNTDVIRGAIVAKEGEGLVVELTMNDVAVKVPASYSIDGETVSLKTSIELANWNGMDAIAALNKVCEAGHKGTNGESILWPTVDIVVTSTLKQVCN